MLVDRAAESVLLCDHRAARLWLPTGGHVEPGEHPYATVRREVVEELGITAVPDPILGEKPFLLTVTETNDVPENRHTDISLWFALAGTKNQALKPDEAEFAGVRWWRREEIQAADPRRFDPHLGRASTPCSAERQAPQPQPFGPAVPQPAVPSAGSSLSREGPSFRAG